jgi:lysophospholipase
MTDLARVAIPGFNTTNYIQALRANVSATPNIGMTFSGGGQRAFICGLGVWQGAAERDCPIRQQTTIAQLSTTVMHHLSTQRPAA